MYKRQGDNVGAVTLGDFADVPVDGHYALIYIVWNTFFNPVSYTHLTLPTSDLV